MGLEVSFDVVVAWHVGVTLLSVVVYVAEDEVHHIRLSFLKR